MRDVMRCRRGRSRSVAAPGAEPRCRSRSRRRARTGPGAWLRRVTWPPRRRSRSRSRSTAAAAAAHRRRRPCRPRAKDESHEYSRRRHACWLDVRWLMRTGNNCVRLQYLCTHRERKCADTIGTVLVPYRLATSNAKILIYSSNKICGSYFIEQHSETVMFWNHQNADCRLKNESIYFVIYYNFRHTFVLYSTDSWLAVGCMQLE